MSKLKVPVINHDTATVSLSLGITVEREKELQELSIKRIKDMDCSEGSKSQLLEILIKDCESVAEITYMAYTAGGYVERISNRMVDLMSSIGHC